MLQKFSSDSRNICFYKADLADHSAAAVSWGVCRKLIDVFAKKGVSFPSRPFRGGQSRFRSRKKFIQLLFVFSWFSKRWFLFEKIIVWPPPFIPDTCFPAVTDVFSCDRRFARRFPFQFASGLLKSDLNLAKTRKRRRFFFLAVLVSRGEVSDVSRNIANSGPSKGGLDAKRELKR